MLRKEFLRHQSQIKHVDLVRSSDLDNFGGIGFGLTRGNSSRVAEVAKLFADAGLIVLVSFISPFRAERRMARELVEPGLFHEVFVDTPIDVCRQRDPKGLYRKADAGQIRNFTGIDSPYEPPEAPEFHLRTETATPDALADAMIAALRDALGFSE